MDLAWLARNVGTSWRHRGTSLDALKRLLWIYSSSLPAPIRRQEWLIRFSYQQPVGSIRLVLRANLGADAFIHSEVFEHRYYELGLQDAPESILDLGANIGLTSIYFARCFPAARIAAVEPMPGNLRLLRKNLALNDVVATVVAGAIDEKDGQVLMDVGQLDYGHHVLEPARAPQQRGVEVAAYSIPTLLQTLAWDRIGLLKVDIEGHEKVLLANCASWIHRVDTMCIECHEGFGEFELKEFAQQFDFRQPVQLPGIWLLRR